MKTADSFYHAHRVINERCNGRMKCVKACPTKAIRYRQGKVTYYSDLCIDCSECLNACPEDVFVPVIDEIKDINHFKYLIALPSPVLYTQFGLDISPALIHQAFKRLGFNEVIDLSDMRNELNFALFHHVKNHNEKKPMIISYCPTIIRLIQVLYPNLVKNIAPFDVPREIKAKEIKMTYPQKLNLKPDQIGVIYVTPCPAKIVSIKQPAEKERSWIDSAIPVNDMYNLLLPEIMELQKEESEYNFDNQKFHFSRGWVALGHVSSKDICPERCLTVSGLDHVKKIFDDIENSKLRDIDFVEALACIQECLGGAFCVENPYLARHNSILLQKKYGVMDNLNEEKIIKRYQQKFFFMEHPVLPRPTRHFDKDIATSIKRMRQKEKIYLKLPLKDCGLCGAPTCETFAEDCARGDADLTNCVFFAEKINLK
ncbi:MAG: [Fe-Fe] hydrogenase large subunit C-terminal domain-containing protein [bacterium]